MSPESVGRCTWHCPVAGLVEDERRETEEESQGLVLLFLYKEIGTNFI